MHIHFKRALLGASVLKNKTNEIKSEQIYSSSLARLLKQTGQSSMFGRLARSTSLNSAFLLSEASSGAIRFVSVFTSAGFSVSNLAVSIIGVYSVSDT